MTNSLRGIDWKYWLIYLGAVLVAGYHTFMVFRMTDPWPIALLAAGVVDGLVAWTSNKLGQWTGRARWVSLAGVGLFALVSSASQIIMRFVGAGEQVPLELHIISLTLVPLASTGAVLTMSFIKFFEGKAEKPVNENSVAYAPPLRVEKPIAIAEPVETLALAEPVKRGPGRPKKVEMVAFAKDAPGPKSK